MPTNLENLLESLLSGLDEDIDEVAVAISQARTEKLALMVSKGRQYGRVDIVLYKPDLILKELTKPGQNLDSVLVGNAVGKYFAGCVCLENYSKGFKVISLSGADHGYGPMLYDIALSLVYPESLMPDRGSVSKSARKVWDYYFNNRADVIHKLAPLKKKSDMFVYVAGKEYTKTLDQLESLKDEIEQIDVNGEPFDMLIPNKKYRGMTQADFKTSLKQEYDQLLQKYRASVVDNPLAYAYQIKEPKNFTSLLSNHQKFINNVKTFGVSKEDTEVELRTGGSQAAVRKTGR